MNYIYCLKQQAVAFTFLALSVVINYGVACKCGWREPILLTPDYIVLLVSYSLVFIFIGPFIYKWWDPLKK